MLFKMERNSNWNITQVRMSLKLECHSNQNVNQIPLKIKSFWSPRKSSRWSPPQNKKFFFSFWTKPFPLILGLFFSQWSPPPSPPPKNHKCPPAPFYTAAMVLSPATSVWGLVGGAGGHSLQTCDFEGGDQCWKKVRVLTTSWTPAPFYPY